MPSEQRIGEPPCPHCGRTTPASKFYELSEFQLQRLREIRAGDLRAYDGATTGGPLRDPYVLGLIYEVTTHNGTRRRWRLTPAGEQLLDEREKVA